MENYFRKIISQKKLRINLSLLSPLIFPPSEIIAKPEVFSHLFSLALVTNSIIFLTLQAYKA